MSLRGFGLTAIALVGPVLWSCGSDYSNSYWQDPKDDFSFQGWQEPEQGEAPKVLSAACRDACAEVEACWDADSALPNDQKQMTTFPIPEGRCADLCSQGLLKDSVWQCLADTLQKDTNPNYCRNKDLCFSK